MLVISRFEGWIWVLIASVHDLCIGLTLRISSISAVSVFGTVTTVMVEMRALTYCSL